MVNNMVSFFDFLMPENSGIDAVALDRARSAGLLNAANNLATLSAPGFNKAAPTSLQLITGGLTGFQGGAQNSIDQFYTNEVNKSKAAQAGLDTKYASKAGQLMDMINADGSLPAGMATTPPASTPPSLSSFYGSPTQGVGSKPINNPGNLRPVGASTGFRQFSTPEDGMKALTDDLTAKLSGNSQAMAGRTPTLRNLISVYSPSNENATQQLIANAATRTGLSPDQPLTIADLPKVQQAIITQEQGGTGLNAGASGVPSPAGVQQPSSNVGDAYLSNQIRTLGMLQAAAGKPNAANMLEMGLQLDPRFSFMRNKNMPAVMQIADAMSNAQKNGNKQYLDNLALAGKFYDRGFVPDGQGGTTVMPGYVEGRGSIKQGEARGTETGKTEAERSAGYTKAQSALVSLERQSKIVDDTINKATTLMDNSNTATGWGNYLTSGLPNSDGRKLNNYLNTIKANIGFDKLQDMRTNSPTGGALGQVSDMENKLLQAVNGALDPLQSDQLKENLATIKEMYPQVLEERRRAFDQDYGKTQPLGNNPAPPQGGGAAGSNGWSAKRVN